MSRIALVLSFEELRADVESGAIDTVVVAFTDMQGRLMGKRLQREFFLDEIDAGHAVEGCNYLLALEMEMDPVPGYATRELGAGLRRLRPDARHRRRSGASPGSRRRRSSSATSVARRLAGRPVTAAGAARADRAGGGARLHADVRLRARVLLAQGEYEEAHQQHYRDLTPSVPYILDYHVLAATYDEPFIRQIRNGMQGAGIKVETSKGEAWPGQHEINFRYADALAMADNHVIYKNGAKEIAHLQRLLDHLHGKARSHAGSAARATSTPRSGAGARRRSPARRDEFNGWLAGQIANAEGARDLPGTEHQLVQALRGRVVGADDTGLGPRQPDVRLPDRGARAGAADGDADPRRRRKPLPRIRRDHRGRAARDRERARARRRRWRGTRTSRTPTGSLTRCARRSRRSKAARWRARRSATR